MTNRLYVNETIAAPATTTTDPTTPAGAFTASAEGTAPDAKRPVFAEGTQPQPKLEGNALARGSHARLEHPAEGTAPEAPAQRVPPELGARATQLGDIWAQECIRDLRSQHRDIVGGWPGTLREARRRVLAAMPRDFDPQHLEDLARLTNLAARKSWESVSEPDLEP